MTAILTGLMSKRCPSSSTVETNRGRLKEETNYHALTEISDLIEQFVNSRKCLTGVCSQNVSPRTLPSDTGLAS